MSERLPGLDINRLLGLNHACFDCHSPSRTANESMCQPPSSSTTMRDDIIAQTKITVHAKADQASGDLQRMARSTNIIAQWLWVLVMGMSDSRRVWPP